MKVATSRLTAQSQISVPVEVRRRLGLVPGSSLEWEANGDTITVKRAGRYSSAEIRQTLFPDGPPETKSLDELKAGIRQHLRTKHARR
jgi:AbrB family looped-hinge helix DNA binding protein